MRFLKQRRAGARTPLLFHVWNVRRTERFNGPWNESRPIVSLARIPALQTPVQSIGNILGFDQVFGALRLWAQSPLRMRLQRCLFASGKKQWDAADAWP